MTAPFPFTTKDRANVHMGLVALQADETLEDEIRSHIPNAVSLLVSRVASGTDVSLDTLGAMEASLTTATDLFPAGKSFDVLAYGCTSGTAQIGAHAIAKHLRAARPATHVTDPMTALIAACDHTGIQSLAFLSPYTEPVSDKLRAVLQGNGVETPIFGSFGEAHEATVARIDPAATYDAAIAMMQGNRAEALFLSCTNLPSFSIIPALEDTLGIPVYSSNLVLLWHMLYLAEAAMASNRASDALRGGFGTPVLSMAGGSL